MRKMLWLAAALAGVALASGEAEAGHRGGCGGGGGGCSSGGGGGGMNLFGGRHGGGHSGGGCASGGCGSVGGGYGGGMCYAGGGYGAGCAGGVCYTGGGYGGGVMRADAGLAAATLVVELPADATLKIDGEAMSLTSARRVFQTAAFETGRAFTYELEATVMVKGKAETVKQTVTVRGGEEKRVTLELPTASVAAR